MNIQKKKLERLARRQKRIRAKVKGTKEMPRLAVFRSNKYTYAQIIDDVSGVTLAMASDMKDKGGKTKDHKTKIERARETGRSLAKAAVQKKIARVAFDRGGVKYAGRVRALAEGAREGGLTF